MKVSFESDGFMAQITEELRNLPKELERQRTPFLKKCSKIIAKNVVKNLPVSDLDATATNYDGTPYVHMRNDVKASVKTDKNGNEYAIIQGGKYTGYKWHLLNNGTSNTDATHFVDKSESDSESEIDSAVNEVIGKVVQGGK